MTSELETAGPRPSPARVGVDVEDAPAVQVQEGEDLAGHGVEAGPGLDVVVVVVHDEDAGGVHGEGPEAVEVHLLAELQGGRGQHDAAGQPLGPHALEGPEALHAQQVLRVEEVHVAPRVEVVHHVLDAEGDVGVVRVVEGRENHRAVAVGLEHLEEGLSPPLQLLESPVRTQPVTISKRQGISNLWSVSAFFIQSLNI